MDMEKPFFVFELRWFHHGGHWAVGSTRVFRNMAKSKGSSWELAGWLKTGDFPNPLATLPFLGLFVKKKKKLLTASHPIWMFWGNPSTEFSLESWHMIIQNWGHLGHLETKKTVVNDGLIMVRHG